MKLSPSVYLRAALRVERERNSYCCPAIEAAHVIARDGGYVTARTLDYMNEFLRLFNPWNGSPYYWGQSCKPGARDCRVLALCFMAAIAATETFEG